MVNRVGDAGRSVAGGRASPPATDVAPILSTTAAIASDSTVPIIAALSPVLMEDPLPLDVDTLLADHEDLDIEAAVAAHTAAVQKWRRRSRASMVGKPPRYRGSVPGRRPNKPRDFARGLRSILRDYFGLRGRPPVFDEADLERRYRVPRVVLTRIYLAVKDRPWWQQRVNATGQLQGHPLL